MAKYFDRGSVPTGYGVTADGVHHLSSVEVILIPPVGNNWPLNGEIAFASDWGPTEGVKLRVAIGTRTTWTTVTSVVVTGPWMALNLPTNTARVAVCRMQRTEDVGSATEQLVQDVPIAWNISSWD